VYLFDTFYSVEVCVGLDLSINIVNGNKIERARVADHAHSTAYLAHQNISYIILHILTDIWKNGRADGRTYGQMDR